MKHVLFLDDNRALCEVMKEAFSEILGMECTAISKYSDLLALKSLSFDAAFLDVNLGVGPSGVDAYKWLMKNGFQGKVIFFTGHAEDHPIVKEAASQPNVFVINKPTNIKVLGKMIA